MVKVTMKLLIDSSFMIMIFQRTGFSIDEILEVAQASEMVTLSICVDELKSIAYRKKGFKSKLAEKVLESLDRLGIKVLRYCGVESKADMAIIDFARENRKIIVGTCDHELVVKLREASIPVVYMGSDGRLIVEGMR